MELQMWDFLFRRNLYDWESVKLDELNDLLDQSGVAIPSDVPDQLLWQATSSGLLHWWKTGIVKPKHKIIWESIPFAVIWTVWNTRNQLVFENKTVDWMETTDLFKARVAFWVTSNKDGSVYTMDDIMFRLHSLVKSG
ncbi:hypothetical protein RHMOL_Rhmol12G0054600 [Rhododendron molle]|uniref:Uncharacterized protein n=1 Tax=Rhododendron molle TaxID=49168 RepID=A0ACC0LFX1_RHOML|nr:hypothetical protein RHMOL_Rhmol12G0054600 [Rhododendron molle]